MPVEDLRQSPMMGHMVELQFPDEVYESIQEYREERAWRPSPAHFPREGCVPFWRGRMIDLVRLSPPDEAMSSP